MRVLGRRAGQRFDAQWGVTTEALLFLGDLDPEAVGPSLAHATHYEPTPLGDLERLLRHVPFPLEGATFVDLGSGLGRAVLLAAALPFRQIVGVEISPALHAVATDNLARIDRRPLRCRDLRLVNSDAARFRFPPGPLVAYLYNPFNGAVLAPLLERLAHETASELALVYHTPVERALVEGTPYFELVGEENCGAVYRRTRLDRTFETLDGG